MSLHSRIPPLAFGRRQAAEFLDGELMSERVSNLATGVMEYRPAQPDQPFTARVAMVHARSARFVAMTSGPVEMSADGQLPTSTLVLPLHGETVIGYGKRSITWASGKNAAILPPDRCLSRSTARSAVGIDIDPVAINAILETMLGEEKRLGLPSKVDAWRPRPLALQSGAIDFMQVMAGYWASFDALNCDVRLVERAGLDDAVLRTSILMLHPELLSWRNEVPDVATAALSLVCEYIDANLTKRITLTDLERVSGLSARRLQYAFRAAFQCSPMQWVTQRRLETVRKAIRAARPGDTLTGIAGPYFSNLGDFARLYRARYGELPSESLAAARSRRLRS